MSGFRQIRNTFQRLNTFILCACVYEPEALLKRESSYFFRSWHSLYLHLIRTNSMHSKYSDNSKYSENRVVSGKKANKVAGSLRATYWLPDETILTGWEMFQEKCLRDRHISSELKE